MKMHQRGATLLELILVVGLVALGTLIAFYAKQSDLEQARARQMGGYLYQYNNAVRSYLAKNIEITTPSSRVGTSWLKNTSCGGALSEGSEFLPCDFPEGTSASPLPFGNLSFTTEITSAGSAPDRKITATTTTSPFQLVFKGALTTRSDLAGISALSAAAALMTGYQKSGTGVSPYTATTDSNYKADPLTGRITMTAGNNASSDVWLRTDGGNKMHASLDFDGSSPINRQILGASRIQNLAGEIFTVGAETANTKRLTTANSTVGSGVIVESDMEVVGRLLVDRSAEISGDLAVGANAIVSGQITTQRIVDLNDGTFYLDPNSVSSLNDTRARSISANPALSTNLDLNAQRLQLGQINSSGSISTSGTTTLAGNTDVKELMVARGSQKVSMYDLLPEWVLKQGWVANDGEAVSKPSCGTGQPMVIVTPRAVPIAAMNRGTGYSGYYLGRSYFYALNSGSNWIIKADSAYTGARGQAIVMTYCYYPK